MYEIDLHITGEKFKHHINVIDQLNDNIIDINFMHRHRLHYDIQSRQVKIASMDADQLVAIKEQVLLALTSTNINIKFKGHADKKAAYIASIHTPQSPMISGMPTIVSIDSNNKCKIIVDNCAPYDIVLK
jgi:hypothetical protein